MMEEGKVYRIAMALNEARGTIYLLKIFGY